MEELKRLEEKYNKMVEISKENLIKYEDLRIDNQKLIMEIENLKSQIDFEAQKQAILLQENEELQKRFNDYQDRKIEENANLMKRLDIADKKLTVFSRELEQANKENEELKARLAPLEDSYFKGLSSIEIAGLAKKSIRITTYNRQLEQENETLNYQWQKQAEIGDEWYKIAEKYKTALEEIKGTIKHFKTYFSEKELNKVKFSDITVIEEIITEAIGE